MQDLLKNGYHARKRPSGHDISKKFAVDNGAAIPPNLGAPHPHTLWNGVEERRLADDTWEEFEGPEASLEEKNRS